MKTTLPLRVLIIDDSQNDAQELVNELKRHNYDPIFTRVNSLARFNSAIETQEWDIILCDYQFKNFNCLEAISSLQEKWLDIPVIIVSNTADEESISKCMKIGANDFISKDKLARLAPAVERELRDAETRKEHHKAKRTIRTNEEYFKNIIETSLDGIIVVNDKGKIMLFNKSAEKLFLYSSAEVLNQPMTVLIAEHSPGESHQNENCKEKFLKYLNQDIGSSERTECAFMRKDRTVFDAEVAFSIGRDEKGYRQMVISVHNITQRKQIESKMRQVQKMEAIGLLAGGVSHDFNNHLTVILGYADMLLNDETIPKKIQDKILNIKKAGEHASFLTRQLLTFSRKQNLKPKTINLNSLIHDKEKIFKSLLGEDIKLAMMLEPRLKNIKVDPGQIEQIIVNLIINAKDAIKAGGKVTIKTENVIVDKEYAMHNPEAKAGQFVRLSIEDNGDGIDKKNISHIFEPFFTTKEIGKGTGLGLSIIYGIVRQHEGWLNVYSELGQGSTFRVYLPVSAESVKQESQKTISFDYSPGKGERVLLLEDDKMIRDFACLILRNNGYKVFEATTGTEALSIFEKEKGKFDIFFSDVVLPDTNGLRLANNLTEKNSKLGILLSSGYIDHKSQWEEISKRGFRFLQKPYAVSDLLSTIREIIAVSN